MNERPVLSAAAQNALRWIFSAHASTFTCSAARQYIAECWGPEILAEIRNHFTSVGEPVTVCEG